MRFCEKLMELRRQRGMTQEQLGEVAGVSRQTVSKWELGDTTPELEKLGLLCDYFHVSMDELTGRTSGEDAWAPTETKTVYVDPFHYEYKSAAQLWGLPLVHINIGRGFYRAKGIFALGNIATGVIALGGVSVGGVALGGLSLGGLAVAGLALGLAALGGVAVGLLALGGLAVGWFAAGGMAVGRYALGGCAVATQMAAGGYARATVAIGDETSGQLTYSIHDPVSREAFVQAVRGVLPKVNRFWIDLFYRAFP